jgi:hypothetical protein
MNPQKRDRCEGGPSAKGFSPTAGVSVRFVTVRSVLVGLLGVLVVCGVTPLNDFALANTFFVGNFLPVGLVLLTVVLVVAINGPLRRFAPRYALSRGELAVAMAMTMVSCALPASGFMRYVPAGLVGIHVKAADPNNANVLRQAGLPDWLFPRFDSSDPEARGRETVATDYFQRTVGAREGIWDFVDAVPWSKWITPAIAWGIFAAALFGAILSMVLLVHRQWTDNERLSFPLASVYKELIDEPRPGRWVNELLGSRLFWITASAVFLIHLVNGLSVYFPKSVPAIPLGFNLESILTEPPVSRVEWYVKQSQVYFCIIGILFFVQSKVSLSLWVFVLLLQVVVMFLQGRQVELTEPMRVDQSIGAALSFGLMILFVARHHIRMVIGQMFRGRRPDEPAGDFVSYRIAGWIFVGCFGLLVSWLMAVGAAWWVSILVVSVMLLGLLIVYRVVAETGLPFVQLKLSPVRMLEWILPFKNAGATSIFSTAWVQQFQTQDMRESLTPFAGHALRVGETSIDPGMKRHLPKLLGAIVLALMAAFVVSGASTLLMEYNFADTQAAHPAPGLVNAYGIDGSVNSIFDRVRVYLSEGGLQENHSVPTQVALGAGILLVLASMRLRFAGWPLHPIGFLLMYTYPLQRVWFSIMLGWMIKVMLLKLGGAKVMESARPAFIGLIVGEAIAAAFWLVSSVLLYAFGYEYRAINLLPT